jgi:hypothetical protein
MKALDLFNPSQPSAHQKVLRYFQSPQKENGYDFYFVKDQEYLYIYTERLHEYPLTSPHRPGEKKLIADQLEIPMSAIVWLIGVIEKKFSKPPEEGGVPASSISYCETIDGERLHVNRSMNAGCNHPGYTLTNLDRVSHITDVSKQSISFSDPWLFQNGLMEFFKDLAEKHDKGEL